MGGRREDELAPRRPPPLVSDAGEPGCWSWTTGRRFEGRPALFLDRDGVVVEEVGYLSRPQDVVLEAGAAEAISAYNRAGVPVVLVTNQSGVARGYFDWPAFEAVQAALAERLRVEGGHLDAVFACGYHESGVAELAVRDHPWRKPAPGMFLAAAERLGLDLSRSLIVGDRAQDLAAGRSAGLSLGLHVATGHGDEGERSAAAALQRPDFEVKLAANVGSALELLSRVQAG